MATPINSKMISKAHDDMNRQLDALEKVATILDYPPDLMHEVRRGWPELQMSLRGIHYYLTEMLPKHFELEETKLFDVLSQRAKSHEALRLVTQLKDEHKGLRTLIDSISKLIRPWTKSAQVPLNRDTRLLEALKVELRLHLANHERLEAKILPLAERVLNEDEFKSVMALLEYIPAEVETELPAAAEKRSA